MNRSSMDDPSSERSILPWLWIIEHLTSYPQVPTSVLYGLINQAPPLPDDLKGKVDELLALTCLEELCGVGYEPSATTVAMIDVDLSKTCQEVLECILQEASVSDIMTKRKPLRFHIKPFILHKRASMPKTYLQKLKDAILDDSCRIDSSLKKMSGVVPTVDFRGVAAAAGESEFLHPNAKKRKIARNPDSENLAENLHEGQQTCDDFDHLTDTQLKQFLHDALAPEEPGKVNESENPENVEKVVFSVEDDDVHMSRDQTGISTGDYAANPQKNSENGSYHRNPVQKDAANAHLSAEPSEHKQFLHEPAMVNESGNPENVEKVVFSVEEDDGVHMSRDQMGIPTGDYATNPQKNIESGSDHRNPVIKTAANAHLSAEPAMVNESGNPENVEKVVFSVEDDDVHMSSDQMGISTGDFATNPPKNSENGSDHRNPVPKTAANAHLSAESATVNERGNPENVEKVVFSVEDDVDVHMSRDQMGISTGDYAANPQKNSEIGSDHRNSVLKNAANAHLSAEPPEHNLDDNQNEESDITMKRSDFSRSQNPPMGDSLDDWTPGDVCVKCSKDDDQLLVCRMESCFFAVHEKCLGFSVAFDETGNFCCPSCSYSAAVKEYRESKKVASSLRKDMAVFLL